MNTEHIYEAGLGKNQANYTPLSPLTFIERAASVYPDYVSVVHGETRFTWAETYARCRRLASALRNRGIGKNDTVSVMLPNIPPCTRPISAWVWPGCLECAQLPAGRGGHRVHAEPR